MGVCDVSAHGGEKMGVDFPISGSGAVMALQADGEQYPWVLAILAKGPAPTEAVLMTAHWEGKVIILRIEPPEIGGDGQQTHFTLGFQDLGSFVGRIADMHRLWRFFAMERARESELPTIAKALLAFPTPQKDTEAHERTPGFISTEEVTFGAEHLATELNVGYGTNADGDKVVVLTMLGKDGPLAVTSLDSFPQIMSLVVDLMGSGRALWKKEAASFERSTKTRAGKDAFISVHTPRWAKF